MGSVDYAEESIGDGISPDFEKNKSRLHLTEGTHDSFDMNENTAELVQSQMAREQDEIDEYEGEESESDQDPSDLGYRQDILENSNYHDKSIDDQTNSQYLN